MKMTRLFAGSAFTKNESLFIKLILAFAVALWGMGLAIPAYAAQEIDCPLRDQPYSIDTPLIDILLKPEAKALLSQQAPNLLENAPARFMGTTAPSFSSIITLRVSGGMQLVPQDALAPLNRALAALPVTDADRVARCARYDIDRPNLVIPKGKPRLLLFEKITGFRDDPSVAAAGKAFRDMATRHGWALVSTDKGGAITPDMLRKFDAVIWNNISGDVLTLTERRALKNYIERGGGFVGVHGSGGDPIYFWDWYADTLIGARFIGHPMNPQFQDAQVLVENSKNRIGHDLAPGWTMKDEWYSFKMSPRAGGADIVAKLDEGTYSPIGMGNQDLHMGDHPIAWTNCVGSGRSFYSAIGHRPETYTDPHYVKLLEDGIKWAAGMGVTQCRAGREVGKH